MTQPFDRPLRGVLHHSGDGALPCVLIAHGFKGFMGWGMFPWIADRLAEAGFAAVRFDFALNGADENGDFTRLDLFRENTLAKEQEDLAALLGAVASGAEPFGGRCRPERIGLLGHSRGGGGVIECGAGDERVAAVATIAAIAHTNRFPAEAHTLAEAQGYFEVPNARTGQMMPIGVEAFRDGRNHDYLDNAASFTKPLLVVHGTEDESVPAEEGRRLADAAGEHGTLFEIEGAGHTLGAVHPFAGPTPALKDAMAAINGFFLNVLA